MIQEKFDEWMVDEGKPLVSKALALIAKVRYTSIIHQATNILQLESESNEEWSLFVAVTSTLFAKSGHIQRLTSYLEQTAPQDTTLDLILDDILGLDTYLSMAIQDYSKAGSGMLLDNDILTYVHTPPSSTSINRVGCGVSSSMSEEKEYRAVLLRCNEQVGDAYEL